MRTGRFLGNLATLSCKGRVWAAAMRPHGPTAAAGGASGKGKPKAVKRPPDNSVQPADSAAWRAWLTRNHGRDKGVWLVTLKKGAPGRTAASLSYDGAVDDALCYGWIDSTAGKLDEARTLRWFAPRKRCSVWSRVNKNKVAKLFDTGLMTPPGIEKVEAAKADGSWTQFDAVDDLVVPNDLAAAFVAHPGSRDNWEAFPRSAKHGILAWIAAAKRADTRQRRVEESARQAADNQRATQPKPRPSSTQHRR
mmetsp:Transcript_37672/g.97757  ORF Transcript_37672/g.97757 Transcript_37672/m.97757 type:complete len:251 (-) Transcript_37672:69-821(-)